MTNFYLIIINTSLILFTPLMQHFSFCSLHLWLSHLYIELSKGSTCISLEFLSIQ